MNKKILLLGYYGFGNAGDELILLSLLNEIKHITPETRITVLSNNPHKTSRDYGVRAVNRRNPLSLVKEIWATDIVVLGGGGLLQDTTSKLSLIYYLGIIWISVVFSKRVMLISQGIGPITAAISRLLTRITIQRVDTVATRDSYSLNLLKKLGISNPKMHVIPDPVFLLDIKDIDAWRRNIKMEGSQKMKYRLCFCVREWRDRKELINRLVKLLKEILKEFDFDVVFIAFHKNLDRMIYQELISKIESSNLPVPRLLEWNDLDSLINTIKEVDIMVAMRYHALVLAAIIGIPSFALSYDPKIKNLVGSLGNIPMIDIERFDPDEVKIKIKDVWESRQTFKNGLYPGLNKVKQNANRVRDLIRREMLS